jgi:hypothetical protein
MESWLKSHFPLTQAQPPRLRVGPKIPLAGYVDRLVSSK